MTVPTKDPVIQINPTGPVGQMRPIALLKGAQVVALILFSILVPRFMGPGLYGQFAVILSVLTLWRMSCNIGGRYIFGRFVPEYAARGETHRVRAVFMHVLGTRVLLISIAAPTLYLFLRHVLPSASRTTLAASTLAFVVTMVAGPMYNVYFGLNRLGISMINDPIGRFLLLILVFLIGGTASLERASLALLMAQGVVLGVGLAISRRMFTLDRSVWDLRSITKHVRFGIVVFSANILLRVPWRLGESGLALANVDSSEVAYFSVAVSAVVAFNRLLGSATTILIPSLSLKQASGDRQGRDRSLGMALRYLTVAAGLFVLFVIAVGPKAVTVLLGDSYLGVVPSLLVLSVASLAVPLLRTALSLGVVVDRPGLNVKLGLVAVSVFAVVALILIPTYSSVGASIAVTLSLASAAVVGAFQIRKTGVLVEAQIRSQVAAAVAAALVLVFAGLSPITACVAAALYVALLTMLRVVRWDELSQLLRSSGLAFWARDVARDPLNP